MAWYRTGNVAVTADDTVVTGTGTLFATHVRVGDGFVGPDGRMYEVTNIASEAVLSIYPPYQGATATGQDYSIIPVQGYPKRLADRAGVLVDEVGELPARIDEIDDVLATLGSAAEATLVSGPDDTEAGRVPTNGWMGLGGRVRERVAGYNIDQNPAGSGASFLNSPTGGIAESGYLIDLLGASPGYFKQVFASLVTGELKHRQKNGGAFDSLRTIFDTGNCTYQSTSNGHVWRFSPHRLQICWLTFTLPISGMVAYGSLFQTSYTLPYPATFVSPPSIAPAGGITGAAAWASLNGAPGLASAGLRIIDAYAANASATISFIAIGKY